MSLNSTELLTMFELLGMMKRGNHFILNDGKHASMFIQTAALTPHTKIMRGICESFAEHIQTCPDFVVTSNQRTPIGYMLADALTRKFHRQIYAIQLSNTSDIDDEGQQRTRRIVHPAHTQFVDNQGGLFLDLILSSNRPTEHTVRAITHAGGAILEVACLIDLSGYTAETLRVKNLHTLISQIDLHLRYRDGIAKYSPDACPLCARNIPISLEHGRGASQLRRDERVAQACIPPLSA